MGLPLRLAVPTSPPTRRGNRWVSAQMRHSKHLIGGGKADVQLLEPAVGAPLEREVRLHASTAAGPCCNNQPPLWADTQIGHGETREEVRRSYC